MRNHNRGFMLAALVVLLTVAGNNVLASGKSGKYTIEWIKQYPDGRVVISSADSDWDNPDLCDKSNRVVMVPPEPNAPDDTAFRERFTIVLGAHLTARTVEFWLGGCELIGSTSYPRAKAVTVY